MDKKEKENIKRIVGDGLSVILSKLNISKPSTKMERALKKQTRKLADHIKAEVKRQSKEKTKKINGDKSAGGARAKKTGGVKQKKVGKTG